MTHIYTVTGMTCNGCKASVEKILSALPEIKHVIVDFKESTVYIEQHETIVLKTLQNALGEKYKIRPNNDIMQVKNEALKTSQSKFQQLKPLIIILSYILLASILITTKNTNSSSWMFNFMGLFFIVFSFFKILDFRGFVNSFKMYDPLAKRLSFYAWIYPLIEITLGLLFLYRFKTNFALLLTLLIITITTFGVIKVLSKKNDIQCACLGTVLKLPMTLATLIENGIMIFMALFLLLKTQL